MFRQETTPSNCKQHFESVCVRVCVMCNVGLIHCNSLHFSANFYKIFFKLNLVLHAHQH